MELTAKITGIKYKPFLLSNLKKYSIIDFDVNKSPSTFLLSCDESTFAVSKWVSPKRTRSYPFERVYNTLGSSKKITIIPIVKDEGINGDRDYIQWDTISLMSLLDVYVVFAYYNDASKKGNKISYQKFDNNYIKEKISDISNYHSSALHWNLNEVKVSFKNIIELTQNAYDSISNKTGVGMHSRQGLDNFQSQFEADINSFMEFSRKKAKNAQTREISTIQPKESLSTKTKAKLTIYNYLGGQYFFTVDEIEIDNNFINLIESKHSKSNKLPGKSDIKDGLLKMVLYTNFQHILLNDEKYKYKTILRLTSGNLIGQISSICDNDDIDKFIKLNNFSKTQIQTINLLINESRFNGFILSIGTAND